jgi:recombination protein RecA
MLEDERKKLDHVLSQISQNFGKDFIKLGNDQDFQVSVISTGISVLDTALGIGGFPKGKIVEIYGTESSGKSTMALRTIKEAQKLGGAAVYIDVEHSFNTQYAKHLGVNVDELIICQPEWGEQALEAMDEFIKSNAVDVIVLDSVAALTPKFEMETDMGDINIGIHAKLMNHALKKMMGSISRSKTLAIFINQLRDNITEYGPPETTTGGRALKHWATVRIETRRDTPILSADCSKMIGGTSKVRIKKNGLGVPGAEIFFKYYYDRPEVEI